MLGGLQRIRRAKGLRREELATRAGVSIGTIASIERGGGCRMATAVKLAEALEVTVAELMAEPAKEAS